MSESFYEDAELYDVIYDDKRFEAAAGYWEYVLRDVKDIRTIYDCSIGTGQMTLSLAKLGFRLSGSDLSQDMLRRCRKNADERGIAIELSQCDFRKLTEKITGRYDCVISTGNSLPHVAEHEAMQVLHEMDALVGPCGYLYVDLRNWDKILRERKRFYCYDPFWVDGERINIVQVWDYHEDGTVTFNLLHTFEKEQKIYRKEVSSVSYYPLGREAIEKELAEMGYQIIAEKSIDGMNEKVEECDWYYILAKKAGV